MLKITEDKTKRYYNMLDAFRADNSCKKERFDEYSEKERKLFQEKNKRLMYDIDLLEELEFNLRHNFIKIVEIDREELDSNEEL